MCDARPIDESPARGFERGAYGLSNPDLGVRTDSSIRRLIENPLALGGALNYDRVQFHGDFSQEPEST